MKARSVPNDGWARLVAAASRPAAAPDPELLHCAVRLGLDVAPRVVGCSITQLSHDGRARTSANTDDCALDLDRVQYAAGDGPCLAAARTARRYYLIDLVDEPGFPEFAAAAADRGVRSSLSIPVVGGRRPAALNMYAAEPDSFGGRQPQAVAAFLARCVRNLLSREAASERGDEARVREARARAGRLTRAEERLMATHGLPRSEAFLRLSKEGEERRLPVHDVVDDLLARESGESPR
jgi:hypothetical protein